MNLTDRFVAGCRAIEGQRTDYPDDKVKGLTLRVTPAGSKSWSLRYRRQSDGKRQRLTIGDYPAFSLYEARSEARAILGDVARGDDPAKLKKRPDASKPRTFGELAARYITGHAAQKKSGKEDERILAKDVLPALEGEPLGSIERADIAAILDTIMARGSPVAANRTLSAVRKVFNWGMEKGLIAATPLVRMKPAAKEASRERVLSADEIVTFWRRLVAKARMDWEMRLLLRLCLVTGQRISVIAGASRDEMHFADAEWHISGARMKNGLPHIAPLSPLALRLFEKAATRSRHKPLLLPSRLTGRAFLKSAPSQAMRRELARLGLKQAATPHDLRRTVGTGLGRLGYSRLIQDKVLAHVTGDRSVAAIYDRYEYIKEKREALDAWAAHLEKLLFAPKAAPAVVVSRTPPRPAGMASPWSRP
jgi:integrase